MFGAIVRLAAVSLLFCHVEVCYPWNFFEVSHLKKADIENVTVYPYESFPVPLVTIRGPVPPWQVPFLSS